MSVSPRQRGAAIAVRDLTVTYERHPGLHHVSGVFAPGSLTAVIGPNGAGKSTLIKAIAGMMRPASGTITVTGMGSANVAYLPQLSEIERGFPITVIDTVLLGHWRRIGWWRAVSGAETAAALAALARVGLARFEHRPLASLSAGQFQRVLFARLMLQDSPLILLDEPFTAMDTRTTAELLALVQDWHREGRTIIAVLHDYQQVEACFPHSILLARRLIAWGPTAEVLNPANLERARHMAEAWDDHAAPCDLAGAPQQRAAL